MNLKKTVILLIAAVLLAAMCFAGAGAAADSYVEVGNWADLKSNVTNWQSPDMLTVVVTETIDSGETVATYTGIPVKGNVTIKPASGSTEIKIDAKQHGRLFNVDGGNLTFCGNGSRVLNITGGKYWRNEGYNPDTGCAIYVKGGSLTLSKGANITNSTTQTDFGIGGGVYIEDGVFTMCGGNISECSVKGDTSGGGGVCAHNSTVTMSGESSISDCSAGEGGGVYLHRGSTLTMAGNSSISHNTAIDGGNVYLQTYDNKVNRFDMFDHASISHSTSGVTVNGNCVFNMSDTASIMECDTGVDVSSTGVFNMYDNSSISFCSNGGVRSTSSFNMYDNSSISHCEQADGGGVKLGDGFFNMTDNSRISYCNATGNGGGVLMSGGIFNMTGKSSITNCTAANGGGIFFNGADWKSLTFNMFDTSSISYCNATGTSGGGLYGEKNDDNHNTVITMHDNSSISYCNVIDSSGTSYVGGSAVSFRDGARGMFNMFGNSSIFNCSVRAQGSIGGGGAIYSYPEAGGKSDLHINLSDSCRITNCSIEGIYFGAAGIYLKPRSTDTIYLNVSGNAYVYGNVDIDSYSGPSDIWYNVIDDGLLNLIGPFNGLINIPVGSYETGTEIGFADDSASGAENIANIVYDINENKLDLLWVGSINTETNQHTIVASKGYFVNFHLNDGAGETTWFRTVKENTPVAEPSVPEKEGYLLDGWYTDKTYTTKWDFTAPVTKETTLHAKWNKAAAQIGDKKYASLAAAYADAKDGDTIKLLRDCTIGSTFTINKSITINGTSDSGKHRIVSTVTSPVDNHSIFINITNSPTAVDVKLENVIIDLNSTTKDRGNLAIYADNVAGEPTGVVNLTNVELRNAFVGDSLETLRSSLNINGAKVDIVNLTQDVPESVAAYRVNIIDLHHLSKKTPPLQNSTLIADKLPYGAYDQNFTVVMATVYQNESGTYKLVEPSDMDNYRFWPGFDNVHPIYNEADLVSELQKIGTNGYGHTLKLMNPIDLAENHTIPAGVFVDNQNGENYYHFNISEGHNLTVNDYIGLVSVLGTSSTATAVGDGWVVVSDSFVNPIEGLVIPPKTQIQVEYPKEGQKNNVTIQLPKATTKCPEAVIPALSGVEIKDNKNLTVMGEGCLNFTDGLLSSENKLEINGILHIRSKVTGWPTNGLIGTGVLAIYHGDSVMPANTDDVDVYVAPFSAVEHGQILNATGSVYVNPDTELCLLNTNWEVADGTLTLGDNEYTLEPEDRYTGSWNVNAKTSLIENPRVIKAKFTKKSVPSSSSSGSNGGATIILTETPTATPTPVATIQPIGNATLKPTTSKSPAPFVGLIAGLGAALVLARMRR